MRLVNGLTRGVSETYISQESRHNSTVQLVGLLMIIAGTLARRTLNAYISAVYGIRLWGAGRY